jgi:very-short-patch-repair endonuclease
VRPAEADRLVFASARRQHGAVSWRQLQAAGLSAGAVAHRVRRGWLRQVHRGVYLVGPLEAPHTRAMAATLAVGPGALVSHDSAAHLWGFSPTHDGPIHVTLPGREGRHRPGLRVHTVTRVHPDDIAARHGIPATSPARTLLDLATLLSPRELARATDEARVHRLVTDASLDGEFKRYPRHRGAEALRHALGHEPTFTRSHAERRLLELIRAAGLPPPEVNARIAGHEVDFLWRARHLVVEVDGFAYHSSRRAFARDRRRDADLTRAGLRVLRLSWHQITREAEALIATLAVATAA